MAHRFIFCCVFVTVLMPSSEALKDSFNDCRYVTHQLLFCSITSINVTLNSSITSINNNVQSKYDGHHHRSSGEEPQTMKHKCAVTYCVGEAYICINDECYCAEGYIPNHFQTRCVRCPGLGEKCFGSCCNQQANGTLQCRQGICQPCHDSYGNWICRDSLDQMLLVSSTQIIMAAALILGIITTLILLYRLCAATANLQPLGSRPNYDSRLSIGSLQIYVEERLRDAPPRYTRTAPAGSSIYPAAAYLNAGFTHDSSVPPPPYSPSMKTRDIQTETIHI